MEMPCLLDTVCILLTQGWLDLEHISNVIKISMIWGAPKYDCCSVSCSRKLKIWKWYPAFQSPHVFVLRKGNILPENLWLSPGQKKNQNNRTLIFPFSVWKISEARDDFYDLWRHESRAEIIMIIRTSIFLTLWLHKSYSRHQDFDLTNKN